MRRPLVQQIKLLSFGHKLSIITRRNLSSSSLTQEEVNQINLVIPRLCSSSSSDHHLKDAVNLLSAAVLTPNPPINSLPLSILIDRLALEPDLTLPMYFLNNLKHNNTDVAQVLLPSIVNMLVSSFLNNNGQPKKALKVFHWLSRPDLDFPVSVANELGLYAVLVDGFCRNGMTLESLRVLRVMVSESLVVGDQVRSCVYRSLLREARIREALDLNAALEYDRGRVKEVVDLLDQMIANWSE